MKKRVLALFLIATMLLLAGCGGDSDSCSICNGTGYNQKKTCPACHGSGKN